MEFGIINTALRGAEILWCLLATAMIGNVIALSVNPSSSASAAINFSMFVLVVAWLAALYGLAARLVASIDLPMVALPLDAAATLLTFIDAIVLSAKLKAVNCGDLDRKALPKSYIAWGSANDEKRCREIQAGAVFLWFLFICFAGSLFLTWKNSRRGGYTSSLGTSRPSMTQIGV